MSKKITRANMSNLYASMGNAMGRPIYKRKSFGTVAASIQREREAAARAARIKRK